MRVKGSALRELQSHQTGLEVLSSSAASGINADNGIPLPLDHEEATRRWQERNWIVDVGYFQSYLLFDFLIARPRTSGYHEQEWQRKHR
jgi:hypothetical protein